MTDDPGKAWDAEYSSKGRLWSGTLEEIPELPQGARVLELGCGDGKTLVAIARKDLELHGIDISEKALELAGEAMTRAGHEAFLVLGDVTSLPYQDGSFDTVLAFHVLDHLMEVDRKRAVAEGLRVLKRGGTMHFRGFSVNDMRAGTGRELERGTVIRGNGIISHYFTCEEVRVMFAGTVVLSVTERVHDMGGKPSMRRSRITAEVEKP